MTIPLLPVPARTDRRHYVLAMFCAGELRVLPTAAGGRVWLTEDGEQLAGFDARAANLMLDSACLSPFTPESLTPGALELLAGADAVALELLAAWDAEAPYMVTGIVDPGTDLWTVQGTNATSRQALLTNGMVSLTVGSEYPNVDLSRLALTLTAMLNAVAVPE